MNQDLQPLFEEADLKAERVVAIIRLLIGAILLVFLVSTLPNALRIFFPPDQPIYVPGVLIGQDVLAMLTIASYTVMGALTLWISYSGRYRSWMAWPFATVDVVVAVASVWLGLLNVELVGAYAPLIPASWLLVIVLAFGTLRYNPALQAWLTALSAVLMALTVWHTDGFLGGDWILDADAEAKVFMVSPPTAMRIVMLAAAGLVMTLAVWRARQMLVRALDSAARRQNLRRYLPHQISDMLEDGDIGVLRSGRRGQMTILFLDIRGFTAKSEKMMPEALATFMTGFRDLVTRTADAHNGIVDKFVGDGAMVVFGMQQQRARDPMDALACAEALAAAADDSDPPMRLAIGIHAGEVFCGAVGAESRLEFTVLGDVVNIASRLEGAAKSNDLPIVASADVIAAAGVEAGTWRSLGARQIRGRAEPLALFTPA